MVSAGYLNRGTHPWPGPRRPAKAGSAEAATPSAGTAPGFVAGVALIFAIAVAIRFWRLSAAPVWMDEAFSYFVSQQPMRVILFNQIDIHPPLFYAFQHLWYMLDPRLASVRVPAAIAGSLAVLVVTLATTDLAGRRAGLFAGLCLAVNTGHIYYSQDARMYGLLSLGVAIVIWGLVGLIERPLRRGRYAALYVLGALIVVYAQVVSLAFLAAVNGVLAIHVLSDKARRAAFWPLILSNLVIGVLSMPWLLSLVTAVDTFGGLGRNPPAATIWFFCNMVGVPGLPKPLKPVANVLLFLIIAAGIGHAWRTGLRPLALAGIAGLLLYPVCLIIADIHTPILESRVLTPCTILSATGLGLAISGLRWAPLRVGTAGVVMAALLGSAVTEHMLRVKPEDDAQAFRLADQRGFAGAPAIACGSLGAASAYLAEPSRPVFFWTAGGPIAFDARFAAAFSMSAAALKRAGPAELYPYIGAAADAARNLQTLDRAGRIVFLDSFCDLEPEKRQFRLRGFAQIDAPALDAPARDAPALGAPALGAPRHVIIATLRTRPALWMR